VGHLVLLHLLDLGLGFLGQWRSSIDHASLRLLADRWRHVDVVPLLSWRTILLDKTGLILLELRFWVCWRAVRVHMRLHGTTSESLDLLANVHKVRLVLDLERCHSVAH